jgi:hypothetical protein
MQVHGVEHPAHARKVLVVLPGFVVDGGYRDVLTEGRV